jgi:phosphoribosylamine--glycine ligase
VCKYIVPQGYPSDPVRNRAVDLGKVPALDSLRMYFAAVNEVGGKIMLTGSRAIAFVGIAETITAAGEIAERAACCVEGPVEHRRDIGTDALVQQRVDHLRALRAARPA